MHEAIEPDVFSSNNIIFDQSIVFFYICNTIVLGTAPQ